MNSEELQRIEASLNVRLPEAYRELMLDFPIRFEVGTCEGDLWDDADEVIARNQKLRSERRYLGTTFKALPQRYLFVGEDGAGWQHLLDLETESPLINIMEYEKVETIGPARDDEGKELTLSAWFDRILEDLTGDGIDITSSESPKDDLTPGCLSIFLIIGLLLAVTVILKNC